MNDYDYKNASKRNRKKRLSARGLFKSLVHTVLTENADSCRDPEHTRLQAEQGKAQKEADEHQQQKDIRESQPCFQANRFSFIFELQLSKAGSGEF